MNRSGLAGAIALAAAATAAYRYGLRPWHRAWGATGEEQALLLPGDDLVAEPAEQLTRAITIEATPGEVWPWLVQLGADRGGFYSYDHLENVFGLDIHSADEIVGAWQHLAVGDLVAADRSRSAGWYVVAIRPRELLALQVADLDTGRPLRRHEKLRWEFLWTFALRETPSGATRLLVRERVAFDSVLTRVLMAPVGPVSFVMTRRMLIGIRSRAEGRAGHPESTTST